MQDQLPSDSVTQQLRLRCVGLRLTPNPTYGLAFMQSRSLPDSQNHRFID
jgi:hypothetical protein